MKIIKAAHGHTEDILALHQIAFGPEKGGEIRQLVEALGNDPSARPRYSFAAVEGSAVVGHILFTSVCVTGARPGLSAQILAPLAVLPEYQRQGIGTQLIVQGLQTLGEDGVELVFVLGHPGYYPRFGFTPAGKLGFQAPYLIPEEHAAAWMVRELAAAVIGTVKGKVRCADTLNEPQHWRE